MSVLDESCAKYFPEMIPRSQRTVFITVLYKVMSTRAKDAMCEASLDVLAGRRLAKKVCGL